MKTFVQLHAMSPEPQAEFGQFLDLCLACRRCLTACPSGIDMGGLIVDGRTRRWSQVTPPLSTRLMGSLESISRVASATTPLSNWMLRLPPVRAIAEQVTGLAARRELPHFHRRRLHPGPVSASTSGKRRVAFFTGCFVDYADTDGVGPAVVDVLERNGCDVVIPDHVCTGAAKIAAGNKTGAVAGLEYNVNSLGLWIERGYDIVTCCGTCYLALRHEYPRLSNSADVRQVAEHTFDVFEYLDLLLQEGSLQEDWQAERLRVVCHASCHARAGAIDPHVPAILGRIAGLVPTSIEDSCCGMGGTFGLKSANYELSMTMGRQLAERLSVVRPDVIVSICPSCRIQIGELKKSVRCIHPILLVQAAYQKRTAALA
jgi:glycerol-3-phosphate dehydrogenase subunit C